MLRSLLLATLLLPTVWAQKYTGPKPPKADALYLLHAANLVPAEVAEAKEDKRKNEVAYVVDGAASTARTPLAEPIFLFESNRIKADQLQLYRLEVKNGKREVIFPPAGKKPKESSRPLHLSVKPLGGGLYRIEANEFLQNGEYAITPEGSNQVFLFQVF